MVCCIGLALVGMADPSDAETHQLVIASVATFPEGQAVSCHLVYDMMKSGEGLASVNGRHVLITAGRG